jgi:hypothetical protein
LRFRRAGIPLSALARCLLILKPIYLIPQPVYTGRLEDPVTDQANSAGRCPICRRPNQPNRRRHPRPLSPSRLFHLRGRRRLGRRQRGPRTARFLSGSRALFSSPPPLRSRRRCRHLRSSHLSMFLLKPARTGTVLSIGRPGRFDCLHPGKRTSARPVLGLLQQQGPWKTAAAKRSDGNSWRGLMSRCRPGRRLPPLLQTRFSAPRLGSPHSKSVSGRFLDLSQMRRPFTDTQLHRQPECYRKDSATPQTLESSSASTPAPAFNNAGT